MNQAHSRRERFHVRRCTTLTSRRGCGKGERSPGADVAGGAPRPSADVAGLGPVSTAAVSAHTRQPARHQTTKQTNKQRGHEETILKTSAVGPWLAPATSAPGLGLTPAHICTRTGLTPAHICAGTWAHPCNICAGTERRTPQVPAVSWGAWLAFAGPLAGCMVRTTCAAARSGTAHAHGAHSALLARSFFCSFFFCLFV
jgi:hypothetical protein